jgi:predicted nucleic-acid-binding protein
MIGLDTNVLLRLVLDDDPEQAERARSYFGAATKDGPAIINPIVLAELAWTAAKQLKLAKSEVIAILDGILASDDLQVVNHQSAVRALTAYRAGKADFADYYLSFMNIELGCTATATFDGNALTSPNFIPIP